MSLNFYSKFLILMLLIVASTSGYSQCTGGTNGGSITPSTTAWQTTSITAGRYYSFSATIGSKYIFSFCQGGGSTGFDTQITILTNTGTAVSGAYNDDYCGIASHLEFFAPATATYRIYITKYNCANTGESATFAYLKDLNDNPCSAYKILNPSCETTYSTYSNNGASHTMGYPNPGCAVYNGDDVWFRTIVPFSGSLIISTNTGQITNGGMAVYKAASSCSGAFTQLACNDNFIGNMPQISLTGQTPGDSIFIRFWAYNKLQSGTYRIYVNDPNPTYCYTGSAIQNFSSGGCIQVTPNIQNQSGCIWNKTQISLASSFNYFFFVNLGSNDGGADGLCFALQNSAAGMSALGTSGQNLGMGGIPNSVAIEFDTYNNGGGFNDIAADHTAISLNGNIGTPVSGPIQASSTNANIEDGVNHQVNVAWNATTKVMTVYFDGVLRLTYNNDLVANVFGGDPNVYWGFSGSTGSFTNTQIICPGSLPGNPLPITWSYFNATSNGDDVTLDWATSEEINTKEFIIERSLDGATFQAVGSVKASGISKSKKQYQYIDESLTNKKLYYRIKSVDLDESYSYSEIKFVELNTSSNAYVSISPNPVHGNEVTLSYYNSGSEEDRIIMYDQYGKELLNGTVTNGLQKLKVPEDIKSGFVYITIITNNGTLNQKLLIASE